MKKSDGDFANFEICGKTGKVTNRYIIIHSLLHPNPMKKYAEMYILTIIFLCENVYKLDCEKNYPSIKERSV